MRTRPPCTIADCGQPHFGRGYCQMHYTRWRNHGDPNIRLKVNGDPEANFFAKVDRDRDGCWVWTGSRDPGGYGTFRANERTVGAHRWSYEHAVGPIPAGLELDHLCHTNDATCPGGVTCLHRRCVNPEHLEPVPPRTNWSRGRAPSAANANKTECAHGHAFDEANTIRRPSGTRGCRACGRESTRRYQARKKVNA